MRKNMQSTAAAPRLILRLAACLLTSLVLSCGSDSSSRDQEAEPEPAGVRAVDPAGVWPLKLAVKQASGECSDDAGRVETVEFEIRPAGNDRYILVAENESTLPLPESLNAVLEGDELYIAGSYVEQDGSERWTATLKPESKVRLSGDSLSGTLVVRLSGGLDCEEVIAVSGERVDRTTVSPRRGTYIGAWNPALAGGSFRVQVDYLPTGLLTYTFQYDFQDYLGHHCSNVITEDEIRVSPGQTFQAAGSYPEGKFELEGAFVSDVEVAGSLSFKGSSTCSVVTEGPFHAHFEE